MWECMGTGWYMLGNLLLLSLIVFGMSFILAGFVNWYLDVRRNKR